MKVGHWLFRKLVLCQKIETSTFLITAGSIDIALDIVVLCGFGFCFVLVFYKGHKFIMAPNCLFRLLPESKLSFKNKIK